MSALAFLATLGQKDIQLFLQQGKLRVKAPKGAATKDIVAQIRTYKDELTQLLQRREDNRLVIPKHDSTKAVAATVQQQSLWFIDKLAQQSIHYNLTRAYHIQGALNKTALIDSLQYIYDGHGSLRTHFYEDDGIVYQQVKDPHPLGIEEKSLNPAQRQQTIDDNLNQTMDLTNGPLFKVTLVDLGDNQHMLLLCIHHIIIDGQSMTLLLNELQHSYQAIIKEQPIQPQTPCQFIDYAAWHQQYYPEHQLAQDQAYWQQQFVDIPPAIALPIDKVRPPSLSSNGAMHSYPLPSELISALEQLSQKLSVTLFHTLFSAFAILLARYSGSQDLVIGTPTANRNTGAVAQSIGYFANVLAIRVTPKSEQPFADFVDTTKQNIVSAFAHQQLALQHLIDILDVPRELGRSPLVQIVFALQNQSSTELKLDQLEISPCDSQRHTAKFELGLYIDQGVSAIDGATAVNALWEFNTDLFNKQTIDIMARSFEQLLWDICKADDKPIARLNLTSDEQRQTLLTNGLGQAAPYPNNHSIDQVFTTIALKNPQAIALVSGEEQLTYGQLLQQADKLAAHLISKNIPNNQQVGICIPRSFAMIISILAILKTGRAYVPLDAKQPPSRLQTMVDESGVTYCLVNHNTDCAGLPSYLHTIDVSQPFDEDVDSTIVSSNPDAPAYINFSSGTTGKPKAIVVPHRGVLRLVKEQDYAEFSNNTVMTHVSTLFFDAATVEIWGSLLNGGCCVLLEDKLLDCQLVKATIAQHNVDTMLLTTGLFHTLCSIDAHCFNGLKQLMVGGDIVSPSHAVNVYKAIADVTIINVYGPTENTTFTSCYRVPRDILTSALSPLPIGPPIHNTSVLILDEHLALLPSGCVGEMYLGGDGLALGYMDPQLTSEKFVNHPFLPNQRLYRSGDLARWDHRGLLMFIGRQDNQVKFNGFRIELEEINLALLQHDLVKDAIAMCHTDENLKQHLTGYVVTGAQNIGAIYDYLATKLPSYMTPTRLIPITTIPLTSIGKVNRQALLQLKPIDTTSTDDQVPLSALQTTVGEFFQSVLNANSAQSIGLHQHFFRAGGHSLIAMQVMARLNQHFGLTLPIKALFDNPTIHSLSQVIENALMQTNSSIALPKVIDKDASGTVLSSMQYSLWLLAQTQQTNNVYNVPINVKLSGQLDKALLIDCLQKLYYRHEVLRSQFITVDNIPRQIINPSCELVVETLMLPSTVTSLELNNVLHADILQQFDLQNGPLFCARLIQSSSQLHYLSLNMHHIICDGWSINVLLQELGQLYRSKADLNALTKLEIQYADYSHWQQAQLGSSAYEISKQFWLGTLAQAPQLLELPTAKTRPQVNTNNGAQFEFEFDQDLYQKIEALSKTLESTFFTTTLTAFYLLIYRFCGQDDIVVGTPASNRHLAMLEPLVGYFVNPLPLRCKIDGTLTFGEQLQQVKNLFLNALEHQHYPFTDLVEALQQSRSSSYSPVFQMMFDVQEQTDEPLSIVGIEAQMQRLPITRSKFDLTLSIIRKQGRLSGSVEYNTDVYDANAIEQLSGAFVVLLESICQRPEGKIGQLSLLSTTEQKQLKSLGEGPVFDAKPTTLHQLIEVQAGKTPLATAIAFDTEQLTYQAFNAQANQLAQHLINQGARPQQLIGLCCTRSVQMMVGLLAIIKTGAAYVPLDPTYPQKRLLYMMDDCGLNLIVTNQGAADKLTSPDKQNVTVVNLDDPASKALIEQCQSQNLSQDKPLENANNPDNPAYVIYTSGSTGQPKGVVVQHRPISAHIMAMADYLNCNADDNFLQFASVSFDTFIEQTFAGLSVGASIYFRDDSVLTPSTFYAKVVQHQITITDLSPIYLAGLIAEAPSTSLMNNYSLSKIIIGGDVCTPPLVKSWFASPLSNHCQLYNAYGPTEAVITTTIDSIEQTDTEVTIGSAFTNKKLYVLDHDKQLGPQSVVGELYIGGDSLAECYLNQAQMTQERFIADPFTDGNSRLYRTGDRVRWLENGKLAFVGRTDKQIKIRGFRIEPGEIERLLVTSADVEEALVIDKQTPNLDKILVAYIIRTKQTKTNPVQLEQHLTDLLSQQLPEYMIPTNIVQISEFPQTSNAKIDHDQLPMPTLSNSDNNEAKSDIESTLCDIWRDVLAVENVGLKDSFFKLGGHSVLILKLKSQLEKQFSINVSHIDIMTNITVAKQAVLVNRKMAG